jgi:hypothetical protein
MVTGAEQDGPVWLANRVLFKSGQRGTARSVRGRSAHADHNQSSRFGALSPPKQERQARAMPSGGAGAIGELPLYTSSADGTCGVGASPSGHGGQHKKWELANSGESSARSISPLAKNRQ